VKRARVLLADDHAVILQELHALLEPEFEIVGAVGDGDALLVAAKTLTPDVIVADIAMPGRSGIEATAQLCRANGGARVVLLTMLGGPGLVKAGLAAGALGYVMKLDAAEELAAAIRAALQGQVYLSAQVCVDGLRKNTEGHPG
jgi:DNA-binding NarL/FixJ family response regulator